MSTYEKFERLLKEQNETAANVSKETGIAKSTFSGWKHGKFVPKKEKMEMIANYFDIPVDYFYNDELYEISAGQGRINDGADTFLRTNATIFWRFPCSRACRCVSMCLVDLIRPS